MHILWYIKNVDNLKDICIEYDDLSGPERQERLIEFLGLRELINRSAGFQVVSSRTDSMNNLMPGEESFEQIPIPEQFKKTFDKNNKSITVPVDHK